MARLIGTAGHVDHGKTSLIRALTGIDADRLPEEKKRGMTIDIGFAYIDLPPHGRVSIVDVPGHERFISNMLVGALGTDVCLLCVAADEGVMPQTREHLQIIDLLPVQSLVVALTKIDATTPDLVELVAEEVAELVATSRFGITQIMRVSSVGGEGLEELKAALSDALTKATAQHEGPWYMPIDRAFSIRGHGSVVTGTLARGSLSIGATGVLQPGKREVRVRAMQSHGEDAPSCEFGQRTAMNLGGVKLEEVHRGQAIGAPGALFETNCLDASVRWITTPKHAENVRISIGAAEVIGKVFLNEKTPEIAQLRLSETIAVALGQPLIIRRHSPPDLLGGGKVAVPVAKERRKTEAVGKSGSVLEIVSDEPGGLSTEEICRRLGKTPQELGNEFERLLEKGDLLGFAGHWFAPDKFQSEVERLLEALNGFHEANPNTPFIPRERVIQHVGLSWTGKPLDRMISYLAESGKIEAQGTNIRLQGFRLTLTDRQQQLLQRVVEELEKEPVKTAPVHELSKQLHVPQQAIEEIVKLGSYSGQLASLDAGVLYTAKQIEDLKKRITELAGGKPFTVGEIRDGLEASRKYLIPLLEYLDKVGFTIRIGDKRAIK